MGISRALGDMFGTVFLIQLSPRPAVIAPMRYTGWLIVIPGTQYLFPDVALNIRKTSGNQNNDRRNKYCVPGTGRNKYCVPGTGEK